MPFLAPQNGKPTIYGSTLIGACLGVIFSIPIAALTAASFNTSYELRALVYCCFLLWVVIGAIIIFLKTYKAPQAPLSLKGILLWCFSLWLWPLLIIGTMKKKV